MAIAQSVSATHCSVSLLAVWYKSSEPASRWYEGCSSRTDGNRPACNLRTLYIGGLLAATLQTLVPQSALLALGDGPVISVLVLIALAVLLSICSTVDSFIALSFLGTFTPGAVLAFLVFGPMIDIKSALMLTTTFRTRAVAIIALLCFQLTLLAGVVVNLIQQ